ncbi:hypothetical protein [Vibrio metschnikovii]|uniref:hypothetical protein n=1 Tax=Vibrio metschnikovii TaxID=28172 RepID=UPI0020C713F1|nr:hypothetical protein [Vibrio metschnikovii]
MYDTVIFDYGNTLCEMGNLSNSLKVVLESKCAEQIGHSIERSTEESPNDFDKNHQVKVDTHLVV